MIPSRISKFGRRLPVIPRLYSGFKRLVPLFSDNLTAEQKQFIETNSRRWREFDLREKPKQDRYVLVNITTSNPTAVAALCMSGRYVASDKQYRTLFFLRDRFNTPFNRVCMSYHPDTCTYFSDREGQHRLERQSVSDAKKIYRSLGRPEDILNIEYKGLAIGDLIYDTYLTTRCSGTVTELDDKVLKLIQETISYYNYFEKVFKAFPIGAVIVSSPVYNQFGLLARIALKMGVEVFTTARWTLSSLRMRRYRSLAEIRTHEGRPSKVMVEVIRRYCLAEAIQGADNYLCKLLSPGSFAPDGMAEFNPYDSRRKMMSREDLVRSLDLTPDKPIVLIMSHALTDAVHLGNWMLFNDYLTWLRETLRYARNNPSANWLVKSHPAAARYRCKDTEENEITNAVRGIAAHNIRMLPPDVNNASLVKTTDVVLTARGTAGLEFACFGVPAILAGESRYSGYGFTIEPESKEAYFTMLDSIAGVKRLDRNQVENAKILAYITFVLQGAEPALIPAHLPFQGKFDENAVWRGLAKVLRKSSPLSDPFHDNVKMFLASGSEHLLKDTGLYRYL